MLKNTVRTLSIYEAFARCQEPLTLSELAREIGVAPSTCHALINTLREQGYLYNVGEKREVYPTRKMFELSSEIAEHEPHVAKIVQVMNKLRSTTRETVILGRRYDAQVVYLNVLDGPQTIRYTASAGDRKPLHSSAIGKVILANLDRDTRITLLQKLPRKQMTGATICDVEKLNEDIEEGIARGYQTTKGENVTDVMAIATSIFGGGNLFGLCIAGPIERMRENEAHHVQTLLEAVKETA